MTIGLMAQQMLRRAATDASLAREAKAVAARLRETDPLENAVRELVGIAPSNDQSMVAGTQIWKCNLESAALCA